jgi:geranylgeranyl pyrophosphate synthase
MVFQIADDVLDLIATSAELGKPAGSDIHEGKFTMPVLLALGGPDGDRVRKLLSQPTPYPDEAVEEIIDIVRRGGFADAALAEANRRLRLADEALAGLPPGHAREVLSALGGFLVERVTSLGSRP